MEYREKRNETSGKRRTSPEHSYLQSIAIVILLVVALFFAIWAIFTRLGEKQTDSGADNDSNSYTEEEIRYVVVQADVTWEEAEIACEDDGGHLATITSKEEYEQVVDVLDNYIQENGTSAEDIFYVWLGGCNLYFDGYRYQIDSGNMNIFRWITDEEWNVDTDHLWCNITFEDGTEISEPSYTDADTGIEENRLVLWRQEMTVLWDREEVKLKWTFSDQNENLPNLPDSSTDAKGRIAYICEYDNYMINLYD